MQDNNHLKIDITRTSHPPINDFRVSTIRSDFDYNIPEITEHFQGEIIIPDKWNIGVIVGSSGSGKTTIANQLFKDCFVQLPEKRNPSVVMDMPQGHSVSDITKMFTSLGFSSVPSWLKPYEVLSNGEKMRADLAYTLLSTDSDTPVAFDEFTSVVDRDVAQNLCIALYKRLHRFGGKFIAVTCHRDILDWLQPDWVYDTDKCEMLDPKGSSSLQENSQSEDVKEASGRDLSVITI